MSQQERAKQLQEKGLMLERRAEYMVVCAKLKDSYELVVEVEKGGDQLGHLVGQWRVQPCVPSPE